MTSVLYDVPGPRAIFRNRILAVLTVLLVVGLLAFVIFRFSETGQFTAAKWYVFSFGTVWVGIGEALGMTLAAFGAAAIGSLILGFVLAIGRVSDHKAVRGPVAGITEVFRAVPVLVFMMLLFYGLPEIGLRVPPYWAVVIALIIYNGSVLAEALRAGIESLPRGQREAAYAVGMRKNAVMRLVLLPQAVRVMLPVIVAQLVVTLKDTALGFIITYPELLYYAKRLMGQSGRPILPSIIIIGAIYIAMCLILSGIARWLELRTRHSPRTGGKPPVTRADATAQEVTTTQLIATQKANPGRDGFGTRRRP